MTKANFVFLNADDKSIQMYFEVEKEIVEVKWGNPDYIADHLAQFGVKNADELSDKLTKLGTVEIYEFSRKTKEGKQISGWSVDKPFPEASKPEKGIIAGKIVEVVTNDFKVAVLVELKDKSVFTVVRGFSVYDPKNKKMYPMANKRKALLEAFNIKDFSDLKKGDDITFIRQQAGENYYYVPELG